MAELDTKFELLMKDLNTLVADQNKLLKRFEKNDEKTNKIFTVLLGVGGKCGLLEDLATMKREMSDVKIFKHKLVGYVGGAYALLGLIAILARLGVL